MRPLERSECNLQSRVRFDLLLLYGAIVVLMLAGIAVMQYRYPVAYVYFIHEDSVAENATVIALTLAAVLLLWESRRRRRSWRILLVLPAIAALWIAGEEISWGQRIFGIATPEALSAVNLQGELNLHNIGGVQQLPMHRSAAVALLIGFAASIVLRRVPPRSNIARIARALPLIPPVLTPLILLTGGILIFLPFVRSDELGEFFLSLTFLAWAGHLALDRRAGPGKRALLVPVGTLMGVMLLGAGMAAAVPPDAGYRLNIMAKDDFPNYGLYDQAEEVFRYILSRPDYVEPDTYANYQAMVRRKAR